MYYVSRQYYEREVYPRIVSAPESRVVVGEPALNYCGLCTSGFFRPCVLTPNRELDRIQIYNMVHYFYLDDIHPYYETYPADFSCTILLPSRERAIIDCLRLRDLPLDAGMFLDCVYDYLVAPDYPKLRVVADTLGVNYQIVENWLIEASDYGANF